MDVLINNAGVMPIGPFEDDAYDSAHRQFSINGITKLTGLIPRRLGEAIMTASGSDHLLADSVGDPGRMAYEARIAALAPGAARRGADTADAPR